MKCCFLVSRPSCLGNVVFGKGAGIFLTYCIRAIASVCSGIFFLQILTARKCPLSSLVKYIPIHKYYKLFRCNFKNALIENLRKEGFIYCFLWEIATTTIVFVLFLVKRGGPTKDELEQLGTDIARDWKKLGRRLELDEPIIQEIDNGHGQLSEKGYNMLMRWKQNKGANATYKALHDALQHNLIHRQDLVEKFCYLKGNLLL